MHVSVCAEICDGFPWMTVRSGLAHSAGRTAKGQKQVPDLSCCCVHAGSPSRPRKAHLQLGLCRVASGRYPHSWQPYQLYKRIEALTSEICIPAPPGARVPPASWVNSPSILGLNPRRPPGGRCPHSWAPKWAAGQGGKSVQDLGTGISASHSWAQGPPGPSQGPPLTGARVRVKPPSLGLARQSLVHLYWPVPGSELHQIILSVPQVPWHLV